MALQVLLVEVGTRAPSDSDGNPHCVDLVLESQQAVSNALLVARKSHSNPFDVAVGEEEEREGQGQDWEARQRGKPDFEGALRTCHGEGHPVMEAGGFIF